MGWFRNFKIRTKLLFGFGSGVILTIVLAIIGTTAINSVHSSYEHILTYTEKRVESLLKANNSVTDLRRNVVAVGLYTGNVEKIEMYQSAIDNAYTEITNNVDTYWQLVETDTSLSDSIVQDRKQSVAKLRDSLASYKSNISDKVIIAAEQDDVESVRTIIATGAQTITELTTNISKLVDATQQVMTNASQQTTNKSKNAIVILIIMSILIVVMSMVVALLIANAMTRPIRELLLSAKSIAKGDLNVNLSTNSTDELGQLSSSFLEMSQTMGNLVEDIKGLSNNLDRGILGSTIDISKYKGAYSDVAEGINKTTSDLVNDTLYILNVMQSFAKGDFNAPMKVYENDKVLATNIVESIRTLLKSINTDITKLVQSAIAGVLSTRVNPHEFEGDWKQLANNLNELMVAVSTPIAETQQVLEEVAKGNFYVRIQGEYKGDFLAMKTSLNSTIEAISSYINEVSGVLKEMSAQNFDVEITRAYLGDFTEIKDSINHIIYVFNEILWDINSGAAQLTSGSKYISDTSLHLANGAIEQAESVDKLSRTIDEIYTHTGENEANAEAANTLSSNAKDYAAKSDEYMKEMLLAMKEINASSDNISSVIKIINDIAFQTNLLALNAAVEAARAGDYGKGFAVVAEEVRNLAIRSQDAAKQTTNLIEGSKQRVDKGTRIANVTADALNNIVDRINKVSGIVSEIFSASTSQRESTDFLNQETVIINKVTQKNSAMSEEAAASSQELLSQAEMFRNMVSKFKLKSKKMR